MIDAGPLTLAPADVQRSVAQFFAFPEGFFEAFAVEHAASPAGLTFDEAGLALTAALIACEAPDAAIPVARGLTLARIRVVHRQISHEFIIPAAGLTEHPLFAAWIKPDLARGIADMLRAGPLWTQLAPGAPRYAGVEITDYGTGAVSATIPLHWDNSAHGNITALAEYGRTDEAAPHTHTVTVKYDTLLAIGVHCPLLPDEAIPVAPAEVMESIAAEPECRLLH